LTYSLTNTFSTIQSLREELANIRQGIELSQKRNSLEMKAINQYAKEISQDPNLNDKEELMEDDDEEFKLKRQQFESYIRQFYSKIFSEIVQLKSLLSVN
jgi:hypothetical protein